MSYVTKSAKQHSILVPANQAAVISAAKSASAAANLVKGAGAVGSVTKSVNVPLISLSKDSPHHLVGSSPSGGAAAMVGGTTAGGKTVAALSGIYCV